MAHPFAPSSIIERRYGVALRKVARVVAGMIRSHVDGHTLLNERQLLRLLRDYSESLGPWAIHAAAAMFRESSIYSKKAFQRTYESNTKTVGAALRHLYRYDVEGHLAQLIQNRQVELIKSLPIEAGLRAQELAQRAQMGGRRAEEVAELLMQTESVTESRATMIARTEIAKANSALTQARAEVVGATSYIWETAEDKDVRDSHKEMQGTTQLFAEPPLLSDGTVAGPGESVNCRCFAVPLFPGE